LLEEGGLQINCVDENGEARVAELAWHFPQRVDSRALLRVRDYGPGLPETMLAEIFQPFRRRGTAMRMARVLGLRSRSVPSKFIRELSER
jgi:signal transduction histidine kinase